MTIVIPALALIVLLAVLLPRKQAAEPPAEPDSFDVELYGRWPCDHMRTRL